MSESNKFFVEEPVTLPKFDEITLAQESDDPIDEGISPADIADSDSNGDTDGHTDSDSGDDATEPAPLVLELPEASDDVLESLSRTMDALQLAEVETLEKLHSDWATDLTRETFQESQEPIQEPETASDLDGEFTGMDDQAAPELPPLSLEEAMAAVETLLFLSEKPVSKARLIDLLGGATDELILTLALEGLMQARKHKSFGVELAEIAGGYQFRTKPSQADVAKRLTRVQFQRLSRGAMETLAIISYKQPCMKEDVDQVRGVDSSHFLRTLLDRRLVDIAGRSELPGRPMLYKTSEHFLEVFGLSSLDQLPPLRELESMIPTSQVGEEDPKVKEMRRLVQQMKSEQFRIQYDPKEDEKLLKEFREEVKQIPISTPTLDQIAEAARIAEAGPAESHPSV